MSWTKTTKVVRLILAAALVMGVAASGFAQANDKSVPTSKIERKNRAPVSNDFLQVHLTRPVRTTLSNGMRVLILEDHRLPTATVTIRINGAGALNEPPDLTGVSSFAIHLTKEGTTTHDSKQLASMMEESGAAIDTWGNYGSPEAGMYASGLSDNFDHWFAIMRELLLHPTYPQSELDKLRQRALVTYKEQRTSPFFLANERFRRTLYGNRPAAVVTATPASMNALTPAILQKWHEEKFLPQNTMLGIAGDIDAKILIPKLEKWFAEWKRTDVKSMVPEGAEPASSRKVLLVDRPGSVQTNLLVGNIAIDRRSDDYFAATVINRILGGGPAGRLFLNLREEKGYTYGAYSSVEASEYAGPWAASTEVRTDVTADALKELLYEVKRIREERVPSAELEDAKRSVVANFAMSLESPSEQLSYAMLSDKYGFPDDYWDTYARRISALSAEDTQRIAMKYLNPDALQIVAVGDAAKIRPMLQQFGVIEAYDSEGNPARKGEGQ